MSSNLHLWKRPYTCVKRCIGLVTGRVLTINLAVFTTCKGNTNCVDSEREVWDAVGMRNLLL